jgi:ribonuclease J
MKKLIPQKNDLWFLPLGGSGEIGMNLNLYGHDKKWLMVDMGIAFNDNLGIDVITPDPVFIEEQKENLVGLVVTHAHEDHIGAIPHLWNFLQCPIYATPFTAEVIKKKLAEKPWGHKVPLHILPLGSRFSVGPFDVEFVHLTHSTLEPNALAIRTSCGTIVHSGDWKIDINPQVGSITDEKRLQEISKENVLALVCDSSNAFIDEASGSEEMVLENLEKIISNEKKKRIIVSCFASNLARLHIISKIAERTGRRVCLIGRSLLNMISSANYAGYMKDLPQFIDAQTAVNLPKNKVLFITTGSQGETRAALSRIASNKHPNVKLTPDDLVIFSSKVIPGNEKSIGSLQNNLAKLGCKIISQSSHEGIHVSGHPGKAELKQMYDWVKPQLLVPTHGEYRHMVEQADWGRLCGIKDTYVPENGVIINLLPGQKRLIDTVESGRLGVDGNSLVAMDADLLKKRIKMSINGAVFATVFYAPDGYLTRPPIITVLGLTDDFDEHTEIVKELDPIIRSQMNVTYPSKHSCHKALETAIRQYMVRNFEKKPLICIHLSKEAE